MENIFKTKKSKWLALLLFLFLFVSCSTGGYYLLNTPQDTENPTLTLKTDFPTTYEAGTAIDFSAAIDSVLDNSGSIDASDVVIDSNVNASLPGTYTVTFTVTDAAGNETVQTLTIHIVDTTAPTLTLVGTTDVDVNFGDSLDLEDFITAVADNSSTLTKSDVTIEGTVNTNVVGTYVLTFTVVDSQNNKTEKSLTVHVKDIGGPTITLNEDVDTDIEVGNTAPTLRDLILSVTDNVDVVSVDDVEIDGTIDTTKLGSYEITFKVKDQSGNESIKTLTFTVVDTTAPTLSGPSTYKYKINQTPVNLNSLVTSSDNYDEGEALTLTVNGTVDYTKAGTYTITYKLKDSSGNETTKVVDITISDLSRLMSTEPLGDLQILMATTRGDYDYFLLNDDNGAYAVIFEGDTLVQRFDLSAYGMNVMASGSVPYKDGILFSVGTFNMVNMTFSSNTLYIEPSSDSLVKWEGYGLMVGLFDTDNIYLTNQLTIVELLEDDTLNTVYTAPDGSEISTIQPFVNRNDYTMNRNFFELRTRPIGSMMENLVSYIGVDFTIYASGAFNAIAASVQEDLLFIQSIENFVPQVKRYGVDGTSYTYSNSMFFTANSSEYIGIKNIVTQGVTLYFGGEVVYETPSQRNFIGSQTNAYVLSVDDTTVTLVDFDTNTGTLTTYTTPKVSGWDYNIQGGSNGMPVYLIAFELNGESSKLYFPNGVTFDEYSIPQATTPRAYFNLNGEVYFVYYEDATNNSLFTITIYDSEGNGIDYGMEDWIAYNTWIGQLDKYLVLYVSDDTYQDIHTLMLDVTTGDSDIYDINLEYLVNNNSQNVRMLINDGFVQVFADNVYSEWNMDDVELTYGTTYGGSNSPYMDQFEYFNDAIDGQDVIIRIHSNYIQNTMEYIVYVGDLSEGYDSWDIYFYDFEENLYLTTYIDDHGNIYAVDSQHQVLFDVFDNFTSKSYYQLGSRLIEIDADYYEYFDAFDFTYDFNYVRFA